MRSIRTCLTGFISHEKLLLGVKRILQIFEFEFVTFKQMDILRANIFVKHRIARLDRYTLIEQSRLCTLKFWSKTVKL